jgi:glutamate synthase domain-containing protein 2
VRTTGPRSRSASLLARLPWSNLSVAGRAEDLQLECRAPAAVHELLELDTTIPDDRASVGEQEVLEVKLTQQAVERVEQMSSSAGRVFGCRDGQGRFSLERLRERVEQAPVRAIEIKLSQGAKPGLGGLLPGVKVTPEISAIRCVPAGQDCISPSAHSAFSDVDGLIEFVELIARDTGLPVGIKSAVGESGFWEKLAERMATTGAAPDFVTIDGGEGGTGAAPLSFADHVALPFKLGFARV